MSPRDDEDVEINFPFFHVRVGGGGRSRVFIGPDDEEDVMDMERDSPGDYREVRRHVRAQLRFLRHAFVYLVLNGLFVLVDWRTGGAGTGVNWSWWVALIWGVFLGWEFISQFIAPFLWGQEMEERLIQRQLRRRRGG